MRAVLSFIVSCLIVFSLGGGTVQAAEGLAQLDDPAAEEWFQKAIAIQPGDAVDAIASYADWLIFHKQWAELLEVVSSTDSVPYLNFLRGIAFERLGQVEQASQSYLSYASMSALFPVPSRYRIERSEAQKVLYFEGDALPKTTPPCLVNISRSIYCEASGESSGAMRYVGWIMRNRVFENSTSNPCLNFGISGSTLCDKYVSAINRGFCACRDDNGDGVCDTTTTTNQAAADIYYGRTPEPQTKWCPYDGSIRECNTCDPVNCRCPVDQTQGGRRYGVLYMYGTSGACPTHHPGCSTSQGLGKRCGNGGSDNCFYTVP